MAIVTGGLGQPESGSIVAGGLGSTSETNPNAMQAALVGSSTITANLTATGSTPEPEPTTGSGGYVRIASRPPRRTPRPRAIPAPISAHLTGRGTLTGRIGFTIDPDQLAYELTVALLLDLV